jgi:hypothetical protein
MHLNWILDGWMDDWNGGGNVDGRRDWNIGLGWDVFNEKQKLVIISRVNCCCCVVIQSSVFSWPKAGKVEEGKQLIIVF